MNILITGGGSGLGEAITRVLAKDARNTVYFTYSNSEENAKKIKSDLNNALPIKCDFKKESEVMALVNKIDDIDIIFHGRNGHLKVHIVLCNKMFLWQVLFFFNDKRSDLLLPSHC